MEHSSVLEDETSMSGLSDCLVELEEVDEEKQEIPFCSYLDNNSSFSDDELQCSNCPVPTSQPLVNKSLLPLLSSKTFQTLFTPHGHIHHTSGTESEMGRCGIDEQPQGNYPHMEKTLMSPENHTPDRPTFLASGKSSVRTPRTLMRLQEKHRENERVRHHTLIKNMKAVCSRVPGYDESAKETKVVMMQRVVDYICHLEQHIQTLSEELGIQLDLSNTFLTTKIKRRTDYDRSDHFGDGYYHRRSSGDPVLAAYVPESVELMDCARQSMLQTSGDRDEKLKLRRQKLSSPTVGSTTDATVPQQDNVGSQSSFSSENSTKPAPSDIPFVDEMPSSSSPSWIGSEDYDVFNITPKDQFLHPENSLGFDQADDFGVSSSFPLGSPLRSESPLDYGNGANSSVPLDLKPVNPDRVLQLKTGPLLQEKLTQLIEMKKETYLDRPPLLPITNMLKKEGKGKTPPLHEGTREGLTPIVDKNLRADIGRKDDDFFVSYVPYMWNFHDMAMTRRQKAAAARVESQPEKENDESLDEKKSVEEKCAKPVKVDLRKTSWMNGFMMFSRINRRKFIEANPGVHTSHISKMMGHTWRTMTEEEQSPYKEKAKKYMQYLQKSLNDTLFTSSEDMGDENTTFEQNVNSGTQEVPDSDQKCQQQNEPAVQLTSSCSKPKSKQGTPRGRKIVALKRGYHPKQRGISLLKRPRARTPVSVKTEPGDSESTSFIAVPAKQELDTAFTLDTTPGNAEQG